MDYLCVVVSVILILFIAGCNKMSIELGTEDFPEDLASTDMYILFFFFTFYPFCITRNIAKIQ